MRCTNKNKFVNRKFPKIYNSFEYINGYIEGKGHEK